MADFIASSMQNTVLMATFTAWFSAQFLKSITSFWKHREFNLERLVGAGGMPSSHTALVVSLASAVGIKEGIQSSLFAVTIVLAGIVMYDAAGIRQAAGKQARVINKLVRQMRVEHTVRDIRLKELLGHTPVEVLAGAMWGFAVAYIFSKL